MTVGRDVIDSHFRNLAFHHDAYIDRIGQVVRVSYPIAESQDQYGDTDPSTVHSYITRMIFDWNQYNILLSFVEKSEESNVPLVAQAKISDEIPIGSKIEFSDTESGYEDRRIFQVTNVEVIHEGSTHSKTVTLVPYRGSTYSHRSMS